MRALYIVGLLALLVPFSGVFAAGNIPLFEVRITAYESGTLEVAERIVYDFADEERHGIFRKIPYSYQASTTTYTVPISDVTVEDGAGNPLPFGEARENGMLTIKIGDPEVKVTGEQTYVLKYVVKGPFLYFPEQDELYWNVTGSAWSKVIEKASVLVDMPEGATVLDASCYQGLRGSQVVCDESERLVSEDRAGYTATAYNLAPKEGLSIAVAFPKGTIQQVAKPWEQEERVRSVEYWPFGIPFMVLAYMLHLWYTRGRDPAGRGTIIPQYEPPPGVSPALAGIVYNERIEPRELSAEIVRLAVEGYIRIHRVEEKLLIFTTLDHLLERLDKVPNEPFQLLLLEKLFDDQYAGEAEVGGKKVYGTRLSKLAHKFVQARDDLTSALYAQVLTDGFFLARPDRVRATYGWSGGILVAVSFASFFLADLSPAYVTGAIAGVISGVLIATIGFFMPARTARGVEVKEHLEGFKRYLTVAEKDRLAFHNAPALAPETFDRLLPYAMAFGVEKAWAEQFKDLHFAEPTWYTGPAGASFAPAMFASDIGAFSTDFASASMPASSGSSGGGSVGGGFGGGGGGSW